MAPPSSRRSFVRGLAVGSLLLPSACRARSGPLRVEVESFRGRGYSDRATIALALEAIRDAGGGELHFAPLREYRLGPVRPGEAVFVVKGFANTTLAGHGAHLLCETIGYGKSQLMLVQRCRGLTVTDVNASDLGTDLTMDWRGMDFLHCDATAGPLGDVALRNVHVRQAVSALTVTGGKDTPRASDFTVSNLRATDCYYGLTFQENGDGVRGDFSARNCRRAYIAYGIRDHALTLDIEHDGRGPGADACLLIKRYQRDTAAISLAARFSGVLAWRNLAKLEHQHPAGVRGMIDTIALNISVDSRARNPYDATGLRLAALEDGGRRVPAGRSGWGHIQFRGCLGPVRHRYAVSGVLSPEGLPLRLNETNSCA